MSDSSRNSDISLFDGAALRAGRVHELCGPARVTLAVLVAARTQGPILWIRPEWAAETVFPATVQAFFDPRRLLFALAPQPADLLWSAEEALRSGAAPTVIAELPEPPRLTPVRRLQLAAGEGAAKSRFAPLALLLTPADGGAQGIETRWRMQPNRAARPRWHLSRTRARLSPLREWLVEASQGKLYPV